MVYTGWGVERCRIGEDFLHAGHFSCRIARRMARMHASLPAILRRELLHLINLRRRKPRHIAQRYADTNGTGGKAFLQIGQNSSLLLRFGATKGPALATTACFIRGQHIIGTITVEHQSARQFDTGGSAIIDARRAFTLTIPSGHGTAQCTEFQIHGRGQTVFQADLVTGLRRTMPVIIDKTGRHDKPACVNFICTP